MLYLFTYLFYFWLCCRFRHHFPFSIAQKTFRNFRFSRTFGKVLSSPEFRIACSGCWVFFLSVGLIRGLTVVQDALTIFFEVDATTIMSISASLLAAYAVGGLASGYIIPKCGVRYPTIFSGLSCSLGISLCGMLLWTKSIILMVVIQEREWLEETLGRKKRLEKCT